MNDVWIDIGQKYEAMANTAVSVQRSAAPVVLAFAAMLPGCKTPAHRIRRCPG